MGKRAADNDLAFETQFRAAVAKGTAGSDVRADAVIYDEDRGLILIEFKNGCLFGFPPELAEGLSGAHESELAKAEIVAKGRGLYWDDLDVDLWIPGLLKFVFGSKTWMSELGTIGGSSTSIAKARAARQNGLKGGRPRKSSEHNKAAAKSSAKATHSRHNKVAAKAARNASPRKAARRA